MRIFAREVRKKKSLCKTEMKRCAYHRENLSCQPPQSQYLSKFREDSLRRLQCFLSSPRRLKTNLLKMRPHRPSQWWPDRWDWLL
eukprot:3420207-Amphidinium_carterae.1